MPKSPFSVHCDLNTNTIHYKSVRICQSYKPTMQILIKYQISASPHHYTCNYYKRQKISEFYISILIYKNKVLHL